MKRFLIFFSFLFVSIFLFIGTSYAAEVDLPSVPEVSEQYVHYILYEQNNNYGPCVLVFASDTPFEITRSYIKYEWVITINFDSNINCYTFTLNDDKNGWKQLNFQEDKNIIEKGFSGEGGVYLATFDIYASKTGDEFFFQRTPVTVLAPILEKVEMNQQITTTIVGLAVLLIPLLICLIGFWKACRLLSKILHKS